MFNNNLKNNATFVYTNSWGYNVYMFIAKDHGTMRRSIGIFIESPSGNPSIPTFLKRSQILKSKNCFDFFFDLDGDFEKLDVDNIKAAVMQNLNNLKVVDLSTKLSIEDVYTELCDYVSVNDGNGTVSISNGYCNIDTKAFDGILKELQFGYTRLEILRALKIMGNMRTNSNRPYDWMLTDANGIPYRVYSFKLPPAVSSTSAASTAEEMYRGDIAC
jgi:hypothetical protein